MKLPVQPRSALVAVASAPTSYEAPEQVRDSVDAALAALNLPADFVRVGDHVVLKPNWVKEHDERRPGPDAWEHVITHPAVIEAVTRWVAARLEGDGSIVICDAPQTDSSFAMIRQYSKLDEMIERCRSEFPGVRIDLLDLRPEEWHAIDGVTVATTRLTGDPLGSTEVKLDADSEFVGFDGCGHLYGASFDVVETNRHHSGGHHEYLLCRTPMDADVFINLPKLKTHKKVGLTCALKNLVGINSNKNWLPHYTEGAPGTGGDQFRSATAKTRLEQAWMGAFKAHLRHRPRLSRLFVPVKKAGRLVFGDTQAVVRSGNWFGNDTCWRMVLDLNKCLWFFDGEGRALQSAPLSVRRRRRHRGGRQRSDGPRRKGVRCRHRRHAPGGGGLCRRVADGLCLGTHTASAQRLQPARPRLRSLRPRRHPHRLRQPGLGGSARRDQRHLRLPAPLWLARSDRSTSGDLCRMTPDSGGRRSAALCGSP